MMYGEIILDPVTGQPTIPYESPKVVVPTIKEAMRGIGILLAGISDVVEKKLIDHLTGKASYTSPAPLYLALCTTAPTDTDTSASIIEANYSPYTRIQIPAADWSSASGTGNGASTASNSAQKLGAVCSSGSSVIVGWALSPVATVSGAGDITHFGTCASTTVNTTSTTPTISAGGLVIGFD